MTKSYEMKCPIARTLDVIGQRWTILILREFFRESPCRFSTLKAALPGLATNTLSERLKSLESNDVIASRLYSLHPPRAEYCLTEKGKDLGPILVALRKWSEERNDEPQ